MTSKWLRPWIGVLTPIHLVGIMLAIGIISLVLGMVCAWWTEREE